jgi:2-C-methyl-D-erythritol 2,4-cyclodiphosphate synthase
VIRVGVGVDAHAFVEGRPLVIGGVTVPGARGLAGHSDADVLSHAVADALLGASGLGDIGGHFPDAERWREASSLTILSETTGLLAAHGYQVVNVDATIVAQAPRIDPHRDQMVTNIAAALGTDRGRVSVKASTTDHLGFTGRQEGIVAVAVVLIERSA